MKKIENVQRTVPDKICSKKTFRFTKVITFLLLLSVLNAFGNKVFSQYAQLNIDKKGVTVQNVLNSTVDKETVAADVLQQKTISGKVTDAATGEPLTGVNIMVKGTTVGVITDNNGNFTIPVPADGKKFVATFIGMITQEVDIQDNVTIAMKTDQIGLEEVVVIGYGTRKKRDIIGSVATVNSSEIISFSAPAFDAALQGAASGLMVNATSGKASSASNILVRGIHSLSLSSNPLWVIDGIIVESTADNGSSIGLLSTINPNDVESVEVLKDAAATSIYGSRGSNGVILVTTKSGKEGVSQSNIDYSQGISTLTRSADDFGLANTKQWFDITETARANSGLVPVTYDPVSMGGINSVDPTATLTRDQALATQTDWWDQILRTGSFREINFSTAGGSKSSSSYVSANYRKDNGVIKNESYDKLTLRLNMNRDLTKNLRIETRMTGTYVDDNTRPDAGGPAGTNTNMAAGGWQFAFSGCRPWMPVYKPENPSALWNTLSGYNLVASNDPANIRSEVTRYRLLGMAALNYNIPVIKGLSLRGEASLDYQQWHSINWGNTIIRRESKYGFDQKFLYRRLGYNLYSSFDRTFSDHNINLVAGVESGRQISEMSWLEGSNLPGTGQQLGQPGTVGKAESYFGVNPAGQGAEKVQLGIFGRGNYRFKDKYLVGISFRRDGTSEFLPEYRWGTFTAFSAGWIISDENFMKNIKAINFLKLRGSFGQTGNDKIPGGLSSPGYLNWLRYGPRSWLINAGTTFNSMPVRDVSWETTNSSDFGVDFGVLENRISGSIAYFNQKVTDLLLAVPIPISAGLFTFGQEGSIWSNIGDMKNFGIEFNVNTVNVNKNGFRWTTTVNFTTNGTKVLKLNPTLDSQANPLVAGATTTQIGNTVSRSGRKYGTYYLNEFAGIDKDHGYPLIYKADNNIYKLDAGGLPTTELNPNYLHRYVDPATGKNVILPATGANLGLNRIIFEDKTFRPTFVGGLTNSFEYKGFELSVGLNFSGGNYLLDDVQATINRPGGNFVSNLKEITWTPTNTAASLPLLSADNRYEIYDANGVLVPGGKQNFSGGYSTDQFLVKGDYIRLRSLRLGYDFQKSVVDKLKLQGLSLYVAANNLWTWAAEFKGWDPEIGSGSALPSLKTYYFGVNIRF